MTFIGKHHSVESRLKMSIAHRGKKGISLSAKTRAKTSAALQRAQKGHKGNRLGIFKPNASAAAGRIRARVKFPCPEGYEHHHIDGNPMNNEPSNIAICTRREHMETDGRMESLRQGKIQKRNSQ